jgi:hypothetical protein
MTMARYAEVAIGAPGTAPGTWAFPHTEARDLAERIFGPRTLVGPGPDPNQKDAVDKRRPNYQYIKSMRTHIPYNSPQILPQLCS